MALQGREWESIIELPEDSINAVDVIARYRKQYSTSLVIKTVSTEEWYNLGGGLYAIKWSEIEMDTIGSFYFKITSPYGSYSSTFDVTPNLPSYISSPSVCVVSGNIVDIGGNPSSQQPIVFRIAKNPAAVSGAFVTGSRLSTMPDAYGAFSIALIRNAKVIVEIEGAGIRQQIIIPNSDTANLLDLLPPITN